MYISRVHLFLIVGIKWHKSDIDLILFSCFYSYIKNVYKDVPLCITQSQEVTTTEIDTPL